MYKFSTLSMLNVILIFAIVLLQSYDSIAAPTSEKECPTELNLEKSAVQELLRMTSFKSEDEQEYAESLGCTWKNEGLVSVDGIIHEENFRRALVKEFKREFPSYVAEDKAQEVLGYCKNIKGGTAPESSVNMVKCIAKWKAQSFINYERKQSY